MTGLVHISQVLQELSEDERIHPVFRAAIREGIGSPWAPEHEEPVEAPAEIALEEPRNH